MESTNFSPEMLEKINAQLDFVLKNPHSDFYRKKFVQTKISTVNSWEDFEKIPFLVKDDILAANIEQRTFVSPEKILYYSFSSGTTGNPIPTIIPHASYANISNNDLAEKEHTKNLQLRKMLLLLPPNHGRIRQLLERKQSELTYVIGDIHNLKLMAQIIQELKIDALTTTPTILDFLLEELFKLKFSTENLKYISIGAEFCSSARYAYFKKQFPQATFHLRYGNSEQGGGVRNYRCKELEASGNPNIFHVDENICLIEIVDENGNPANEGAVGEIVTTDLQRKAFPLIRYRLKDMGSLSKVACECGNSTLLTINGRTGFDFLKINGLTLHSELIAEAVAQAKELVELRWQLHLHEEIPNDKPKLKFSLQLKLLPKFAVKTSDPFLIEIISEKISAKLQLSKTKTLKNLAEEGIVLPLEILFVNSWPKEAKSKNIISHIN